MTGHHEQNKYVGWAKMVILLAVWMIFTGFLMSKNEKVLHYKQLSIPEGRTKTYILEGAPLEPRVGLILEGAFLSEHYTNMSENYLAVYLQLVYSNPSSRNGSSLFNEAEYAEVCNGC